MSGHVGYLQKSFKKKAADHESGIHLLDYVRHQKVSEALQYLADGANPDYQDSHSENTALHTAVEKHDVVLVKLMIIFDADLTITNKRGLTPLELAKRAGMKGKECHDVLSNIQNLRDELAKDKPRKAGPVSMPRSQYDDDIYLLTLDGGGIKGLTFIQVMLEIEKRRKQLYPDSQPFLSYFNWVGGNSTGGLSTLALAGLKASPEQGRKLYLDLKNKILSGEPPYPQEQVEKVYKEAYGETMTMDAIRDKNITIMTTIATSSPPKLHKMCNYGGARDGQLHPKNRRVWEAARATSAAVPYFHPFGVFIDGGFIANNPTTDTIIDIMEYRKKEGYPANIKVVLSMGCGYVPPKSVDEPDFPSQPKLLEEVLDSKTLHSLTHKLHAELLFVGCAMLKNLHGSFILANMMMDQITQPCQEVNQRAQYLAESVGAQFFRINPRIDKIKFLETDDTLLINMMYDAMVYALEEHEFIDGIIDLVVGNSKSKQTSSRVCQLS